MSADSDVPEIPSEFHEYLVDYVMWKLLEGIEGEEGNARKYERNYNRGVQIAIGQTTSRIGSASPIRKPYNQTF
jgi:hypothetical protein